MMCYKCVQLLNTSETNPVSGIHIDIGQSTSILDTTSLNSAITIQEVRLAGTSAANQGKALGDDGIPVEVLHRNTSVSYLVRLFNSCFQSAAVPDGGIITPILKNAKEDPRDPLNYTSRGNTVTSACTNCSKSKINLLG